MNYEIVNLEEKVLVGIKERCSNFDEKLSEKIGKLWKDFYEKGIYSEITGKVNGKAIGLYTNYSDNKMEYDTYVVCEVEETNKNYEKIVLEKGKYVKFVVNGNMEDIQKFWVEVWNDKSLPRTYKFDFEEYQNDDMENMEVYVYLSIE